MQHFSVIENSKNSNPADFPEPSTLQDEEDPYWYNRDTQDELNEKNDYFRLQTIFHISDDPSEIFATTNQSMLKSLKQHQGFVFNKP